jgi:hypothetical protein
VKGGRKYIKTGYVNYSYRNRSCFSWVLGMSTMLEYPGFCGAFNCLGKNLHGFSTKLITNFQELFLTETLSMRINHDFTR